MKDGKPEEKKVGGLIGEFEDFEKTWNKGKIMLGGIGKDGRDMLHDFIFWLYEEKEYMIVPQDFPEGCEGYISDIHLR